MYYVKCNKFRKFVNPKISLIFDKILEFYIICSKCDNNDRIFKEEESTEISKFFGLIEYRF